MNIYDNIIKIAKQRNISIREIEFRTGLSNGSIRRWKDSDPGIIKVQNVANYLNVPIEFILQGTITSNLNSKNYILNSNHSITELEANYDISDNIDGYDKIKFSYEFYDSINRLINNSYTFLFDTINLLNLSLENSYNPYQYKNKLLMITDNYKNFYIGFLQEIIGSHYLLFFHLNSNFKPIILDSQYKIVSICRYVIKEIL